MAWTEERVERLKSLYAEGLSFGEITAELGGVSRNAVIGKAHRIGLSGRVRQPRKPRTVEAKAPSHRGQRRHIRRASTPGTFFQVAAEPEVEVVPVEDEKIPVKQRCQLGDLTASNCHWPVGDPMDPGFFFCGAPGVPGLPYCPGHCARAFNVDAGRPDWRRRAA